jgi:hypothetical protein
MSWNRTALSALLAGIILAAALAENVVAQVPIRGPVSGGGPAVIYQDVVPTGDARLMGGA